MAEVVSNEMAAVVPPFDIEAEKAVLGSMMKDADAVSDVIDVLKADDFYEKAHQEIYRIMLDLYRKSIGIDIMTTYSALTELKLAELVGGMTYLSKLVNDAIVSSNANTAFLPSYVIVTSSVSLPMMERSTAAGFL